MDGEAALADGIRRVRLTKSKMPPPSTVAQPLLWPSIPAIPRNREWFRTVRPDRCRVGRVQRIGSELTPSWTWHCCREKQTLSFISDNTILGRRLGSQLRKRV